ncbi:MAG TPA: SH3 domain-containing protein [Rhizomicrobium sp.]|nr:SH3 domain-containing protein [Rhizomicrobium sp.]
MIRIAVTFSLLAALTGGATAAPREKILRYVSQRTDKAYLREGPTFSHKVLWIYRHRGYPYAVIAEFDVWRRVKTVDGTVGWMAASMLTDQRTVLVTGKGRAKLYESAGGGKVVALADPGAIARLTACAPTACHVRGEGSDGWIGKDRIWGVRADEVFDKLPRRH